MKFLFLLSLCLFGTSHAQFSAIPFGSSSAPIPPIGENKKSNCGSEGCSFEVNIKPYCIGANLRSYAVSRQLSPRSDLSFNMEISSAKDPNVKDNLRITFPALLTQASRGIKINCTFNANQDLTTNGTKRVSCTNPSSEDVSQYDLLNWEYKTDADVYTYYSTKTLSANRVSGTLDAKSVCYYQMKSNSSNELSTSSVNCFFPATLQDYASKVKSYINNTLKTNVDVYATINNIKVIFQDNFKALDVAMPVKHGKVIPGNPPGFTISYTQPSEGRTNAFIQDSASFDVANAYKTFTTEVKFVSENGFCGGFYSPLMLFFDKKIPDFNGVSVFKLFNNSKGERINWPEANSNAFILTLPKNGKISDYHELFGQTDQFSNGFEALKVHDENSDDVINKNDKVFNDLRLWRDVNSNGRAEKGELFTLKDKGVDSLNLNYNTRNKLQIDTRAIINESSDFNFKGKSKGMLLDVWLSPID